MTAHARIVTVCKAVTAMSGLVGKGTPASPCTVVLALGLEAEALAVCAGGLAGDRLVDVVSGDACSTAGEGERRAADRQGSHRSCLLQRHAAARAGAFQRVAGSGGGLTEGALRSKKSGHECTTSIRGCRGGRLGPGR
jgi:hypothetical protein